MLAGVAGGLHDDGEQLLLDEGRDGARNPPRLDDEDRDHASAARSVGILFERVADIAISDEGAEIEREVLRVGQRVAEDPDGGADSGVVFGGGVNDVEALQP